MYTTGKEESTYTMVDIDEGGAESEDITESNKITDHVTKKQATTSHRKEDEGLQHFAEGT